jgi:hypothetical protein
VHDNRPIVQSSPSSEAASQVIIPAPVNIQSGDNNVAKSWFAHQAQQNQIDNPAGVGQPSDQQAKEMIKRFQQEQLARESAPAAQTPTQ